MRWRITIRENNVELRGWIDCEYPDLVAYSQAVKPLGIMVASPAPPGYNPFASPLHQS